MDNIEIFLQQFEQSTQTLGGVKKLRALILQLAVQGKLVEQNPMDESAEVLLKKIEAERKSLIKQGKIKVRAVTPIDRSVTHNVLPYSWRIAAIDHVVLEIKSGGTPSKANAAFWTTSNGIFWASVKDLKFGEKFISSTQDMITELALRDNKTKLAKAGQFLICTRMGLGKISICACDMAFNQDLKAVSISTNIDPNYFHIFFQTLTIQGTGTTVDGIVQEKLLAYPIPLPPLAEQKRIVAKVDELMTLCDRLEAHITHTQTLNTHLMDSLIHRMTEAA